MRIRFAEYRYAVALAFSLCANALVSAQIVTNFTLVNADTGMDIDTFDSSGTVVLSRTPRINIRANTIGTKSVVFKDVSRTWTENSPPFAYMGNKGPVYMPWSPTPGIYLINAQPKGFSTVAGGIPPSKTLRLEVVQQLMSETFPFKPTLGPEKNPLKGWCSGWGKTFPEASVGFQYVPWKTFEPENNKFEKAAVEPIIAKSGTAGRHLILRVYAQWNGDEKKFEDLPAPSWLFDQQKVPFIIGRHEKTGEPRSAIDFNDPNFIREVKELSVALGAAYDNDPRVYAIQIGMLGYFGEWHTNAFRRDEKDVTGFKFSEESATGIMDAFEISFKNKHLMGRYPWEKPFLSREIGFHNDFFKPANNHSNKFDTTISFGVKDDTGVQVGPGMKHLKGPIGGEVPPYPKEKPTPEELNAARAIFYANNEASLGTNMIKNGHYSTMQPGYYRQEKGQANYDEYMRLHRLMGYNFQISEASFPTKIVRGNSFPVVVKGVNIGEAPFYYDWDVEFALLNQANQAVATNKVNTKLSKIMPKDKFQFESLVNASSNLNEGTYRIAVRISQPGVSSLWRLDATNVCVQFANELEFVPPFWNKQFAIEGGWSVLKDVQVIR
jgi:hypothetical protein